MCIINNMKEFQVGDWYVIFYNGGLVTFYSRKTKEYYEGFLPINDLRELEEDLRRKDERMVVWWIQFLKEGVN